MASWRAGKPVVPGFVSFPLLSMVYTDVWLCPLTTYTYFPDGSKATRKGRDPVAMMPFAFNAPVLESIVNMESVLSRRFVTYANLLDGSTTTAVGPFPVGALTGVTGINVPVVWSIVYCTTRSNKLSTMYANLPEGVTANAKGDPPALTLAGVIGVKTPVLPLMVYIEIVPSS